MKNLFLSLGHNSSCIFSDGVNTIGYEQERLDRIKSSSNSPEDCFLEILKHVGPENIKGANMFITHWFDNFIKDTELFKTKYLGKSFQKLVKYFEINVISHNSNFTHHDAHAYSVLSFFENNIEGKNIYGDKIHIIVADGFGNNQEVISIYSFKKKEDLKLEKRFYGYNKSLGLMYQYATSYVEMKENQDEYKFLGYESFISSVLSDLEIQNIKEKSVRLFSNFLSKSNVCEGPILGGDLINYKDLNVVKRKWHSIFDELLKDFELNQEGKRIVIGFCIQNFIENVLTNIVSNFSMKNVLLAGGIFYNVKLNNSIHKSIPGLFSVIPLAGDQGAAIGFSRKLNYKFAWKDLCYGKRNLNSIEKYSNVDKNIFVVKYEEDFIEIVSNLLLEDYSVNIIKENMEFGPRALCNTTTLMKPEKRFVDFNNRINGRNEVMPCAPVIKKSDLGYFFEREDLLKTVGSDKFMILTYDYKNSVPYEKYSGIMHKYPLENKYSGRPQIVEDDSLIGKILTKTGLKALVNTSFNVHGNPICFDTSSIIQNYEYQKKNADKESGRIAILILKK